MSTRRPRSSMPRNRSDQQPAWRKYGLPIAGGAAVLLMIVLLFAILVAGINEDGDDDDGDTEIAANPTETPTDATETPGEVANDEPENDEPEQDTPETPQADGESTPQPENGATEESEELTEPTPESEAAPTPAPEPTPEPLVGEFGELPAGDMPSGSPAEALNLQYQLDMSLQSVPAQAPAYQIERSGWTFEEAQALAGRLGIEAEVVDQGNGSFRAEGPAASVYINTATVQYVNPASSEDAPALPDNEQLGQMARSWLTENGLVGADVGPANVVSRDDSSGRAYVMVKPVEPSNIISATPSAGVTLRGDGHVVESMVSWPDSIYGSNYGLRSAEDLWAAASQGRGFVDINFNDLPANFQGLGGTATITSASIAYTIAGSPQGAHYLVPVVVFSGSASIEGADAPVPVSIYVEAVSAQVSPRG